MSDIRQSEKYFQFMQRISWQVEKIGEWGIFIRKFPLLGSLIKIQRITPPVPFSEIEKIAKKHRAFKVVVEFDQISRNPQIPPGYKINLSPFLPTKTIIVDLKKTKEKIFDSFSLKKRTTIRKAEKNGVITKEVYCPDEFIWLKKHSLLEKFIYPFGAKKETLALWKTFSPKNAKVLIAYYQNKPVSGVFTLLNEKKAYYWLAASINTGKKLSAPSLLVWEAIKLAKRSGCLEFDFEGIYDERFPISSWKGFTKFKRGFGGREVIYPNPLIKK